MSGQDSRTSLTGASGAREALKQRCLSVVRRWQPLAHSGWDRAAARQLGDEIELVVRTSERLGLDALNNSALELAAYLCSFLDDQLVPSERDLVRLADMVNALGAVLTDLSATETADVHTLPSARSAAMRAQPNQDSEVPSPVIEPGPSASDAQIAQTPSFPNERNGPLRLPKAVCLIGLDANAIPGLTAALAERGYDAREFQQGEPLMEYLGSAVPAALLIDVRKLRVMSRVSALYAQLGIGPEQAPQILAISSDGDLGHRLLAMRSGASALFTAPVDSLRVIAKLDELLAHTTQPAYRVLLVNADRHHSAEAARWLSERGMTARLVNNGASTLSALAEFRPDVVVLDCELPDINGIELTQLIRQQPEYAAVPIILAASEARGNLRFDAIAAGGDEFLVKPIKARHLLSVVLSRAQRAHWLREVLGTPGGRDPRTGLYSRSTLIEKLEVAFGDRSAALLFIAIDKPAQLREQIGLTGLAALDAHVGHILRAQLDEIDLPAQYQNFHYFTLLHRRNRTEITTTAEHIRAALAEQPWHFNGNTFALTASIGLALLGGEHPNVDAVVSNAEAAQLAAAHLGGNRVLWFEMKEAALLPVDPILAVRAVLSRPLQPEQTSFDFHPIVPLAGKLTGQFEVGFKVRSIQHPGTSIAYADLAPVAEECQQLATLDRWMLQHALGVREEQLKRGRQLRLFVPQSVGTLMDPELVWWLGRELKERHLSGTGLTIELACSSLIDIGPRASDRLKSLHGQGVRICLVDYGRDWAAVHALKNINVDFVRLAPELVEELGGAKSINDTLLALIRKAHAAGAAVIAPNVDSSQRAHMLLRLGVDYALGMAFGRPALEPNFDFSRPLW
jgi:PleD family two-component response regulator/EAL domain-containing protein (putative c-di-GMP-specific phosphodiesterase class I)